MQNTLEYHEIVEGTLKVLTAAVSYKTHYSVRPNDIIVYFVAEEMIRGLQQLGWKKVDVSFHSAFWPFFAHNNIHVMVSVHYSKIVIHDYQLLFFNVNPLFGRR